MLPILKALKERLLNEPAFFLSTLAAVAVLVAEYVDLPPVVGAAAVVVAGVATRAVVLPVRNVKPAGTTSSKLRSEAGYGLVELLIVAILLLVFVVLVLRVA